MNSPGTVLVILSASRSGSSLLKRVLARSSSVLSLAGEEEPYYALTGNGYGHTSSSDAFREVRNRSQFRSLIETELYEPDPFKRWYRRLQLQFRDREFALMDLDPDDPWPWLRRNGIAGYYDGCEPSERRPFDIAPELKLEEPPFVMPNREQQRGHTLLLKTPQNAYRIGALEGVYPDAEFKYVHLTRNFAATMNGLLDGWDAQWGFHSHFINGAWWKFDLPPGWESIPPGNAWRAFYQWDAAHRHILRDGVGRDVLRIKFGEFLRNPDHVVHRICRFANIEKPADMSLPITMATKTPRRGRWRERAHEIEPFVNVAREMMQQLDYSMDTRTWD